jgi:hypothetical protein
VLSIAGSAPTPLTETRNIPYPRIVEEKLQIKAHITNEGGKKLLARVRRIRGQMEGIERAIQKGNDCYAVWQQTAAERGRWAG